MQNATSFHKSIFLGDCLDVMATIPDNTFTGILTDPPYGLSFMGKHWDRGIPGEAYWREALRICKPGSHLLAFGGTRTFHRLTCAIEDAGWLIRDVLSWNYGTGFPKNQNVSANIDKKLGAKRKKIQPGNPPGYQRNIGNTRPWMSDPDHKIDSQEPATLAAAVWDGYGTALKPAWEIILLATKPPSDDNIRSVVLTRFAVLEARLWSMLPVKLVEKYFGLSRAELDAVCGFAQWNVEDARRTWVNLFAQMGTFQSVSTTLMYLNTVSSWSAFLVDAFRQENTYTTETETDQIIDWKILNSCLLVTTPESIIRAVIRVPGLWWSALPAGRLLTEGVMRWRDTQDHFVQGSAIDKEHILLQEEAGLEFKPSFRPIILAMKPCDGTFAENALEWGVAGLNIDGCRVGLSGEKPPGGSGKNDSWRRLEGRQDRWASQTLKTPDQGRWPANVILSHHPACVDGECHPDCPVRILGEQSGERKGGAFAVRSKNRIFGKLDKEMNDFRAYSMGDTGSAARFFYVAKASPSERGEGNTHPTVKPIKLLRYLVRLISPPDGGLVLDPFMGSGSTALACIAEGVKWCGIEKEAQYREIALERVRGCGVLVGDDGVMGEDRGGGGSIGGDVDEGINGDVADGYARQASLW